MMIMLEHPKIAGMLDKTMPETAMAASAKSVQPVNQRRVGALANTSKADSSDDFTRERKEHAGSRPAVPNSAGFWNDSRVNTGTGLTHAAIMSPERMQSRKR